VRGKVGSASETGRIQGQIAIWRSVKIRHMRSALPLILVLLAVFTAGCIAYIAWELSSDRREEEPAEPGQDIGSDE
jgi:hypothetical protein